MQSLIRRQIVFTSGMLATGGLECLVAANWVGMVGVEGVVYSVLLCLVPGWLTIFVGSRLSHSKNSAYTVLIGTAARMAFVIVGLLVAKSLRPDLGFPEFQLWLIVGYLVSLALETWAILSPPNSIAG